MVRESKAQIVKNFILKEVETGRVTPGMRLPSCREIASQLSVNKITVNKAYDELEREHKVYSIPRGGFYLVDSGEKTTIMEKEINFNTVKPEDRLIPYREFTHVINKAVDQYKNNIFGYESNTGLKSFKDTLKDMFEKEGIYTASDRIIITHGAQQAISLIFQVVFQNSKDKLLVEEPTYSLALKLADYLGIEVVSIQRKIDGYDFSELESLIKKGDIAAFYVIPRHHNPTGYTLSESNKKKIAELTNKYNVLVIEDDYLADLGDRKGSMPVHYYDTNKKTVYIRSFSKTFMPGIRLGAAVLPEFLEEKTAGLKYLIDLNTSRLTQAALDIFIKSGMYEKHIKKIKKAYEAKLRKAEEIISALSPKDIIWHVPKHGIFIWLQLPDYVDTAAVEKKLEERGIIIKFTGEFFFKKESNQKHINYLRLCISGVSEDNIVSIANILSEIANQAGCFSKGV